MEGVFLAVVGPSGAGKDTLIDAARIRLSGNRQFVFPRRIVTRPAYSGGERHVAVTTDRFDALAENGAFVLSWRAHGLRYGIPASICNDLKHGTAIVANLSRTVLASAAAIFPRMHIVHVTAPRELIAARLAARGRETPDVISERLARDKTIAVDGVPVTTIHNDHDLNRAIEAFMAALHAATESTRLRS